MLRGWISRSAAKSLPDSDDRTSIDDLQDALNGVSYIFDDDVERAEQILGQKIGSSHLLGQGLVLFLKASLGLEPDALQLAVNRLAEAEASSANDLRQAQKAKYASNAGRSNIYAPGTEFALYGAVAQLMSAMTAVFRESLVEGMKGFLKLNSAYKTLQKILEAERTFINQKVLRTSDEASSLAAQPRTYQIITSSSKLSTIEPAKQLANLGVANSPLDPPEEENDDDRFYDAEENTDAYSGDRPHGPRPASDVSEDTSPQELWSLGSHDELLAADLKDTSDVFIHSTTSLCLGMMLLLLSLIPPSFSRLLGFVGYKGDRSKGLQMLWSTSKYSSPMGTLAGFVLLVYYNGLIGARDLILPVNSTRSIWAEENIDAYPAKQLEDLLKTMRTRFPKSKIWPIEQARMLAMRRNLDASLELLTGDIDTPLKQLQALAVFERGLQAMYSHRFELCTSSFQECCTWNNWSHSLYLYCAGAAQVELYRDAISVGQRKDAAEYAALATKLFHEALTKTGRRKTFGRQLPFDVFVAHKINKWKSRAAAHKVVFMDAIGVSPLEEMIYIWNGFRKMPPAYVKISCARITWSSAKSRKAAWFDQDLSENATSALLQAVTLRSLGRYEESMALLQNQLLSLDRSLFKGTGKEDWLLPAAHYEFGIDLWMMCHREDALSAYNTQLASSYLTSNPTPTGERGKANERLVLDSIQSLERAVKWEGSYMLDTRLGMRFQAALDTANRWKVVRTP